MCYSQWYRRVVLNLPRDYLPPHPTIVMIQYQVKDPAFIHREVYLPGLPAMSMIVNAVKACYHNGAVTLFATDLKESGENGR